MHRIWREGSPISYTHIQQKQEVTEVSKYLSKQRKYLQQHEILKCQ